MSLLRWTQLTPVLVSKAVKCCFTLSSENKREKRVTGGYVKLLQVKC